MVPGVAGAVTAGDFAVEMFHGQVGEFHAADLLAAGRPRVVVCAAAGAALVLGSRQRHDVVDLEACSRAGIDVVKRRSGGGAVLVEPGAMCWFDVVVPADDRRFQSVAGDVEASMRWLGRHVATALGALGVGDLAVYDGPMARGRVAQLVCFAGLGPGEVLVAGRKLVGISQRRTRLGSRFQCMVHTAWSPQHLVDLLAPPRPDIAELASVAVVTAEVAAGLPESVARVLTSATA